MRIVCIIILPHSRVLFPTNVSWVVLEMDPRSITAQPEDSLTVYAVAGTPKHRCHCANEVRVSDPPFRKVYKVESRPSLTSFILVLFAL